MAKKDIEIKFEESKKCTRIHGKFSITVKDYDDFENFVSAIDYQIGEFRQELLKASAQHRGVKLKWGN